MSESAGIIEPEELKAWYLPELRAPGIAGARAEVLERRHSPAVNALFNLVFQRNRALADLDWKYWDNPDGPAAGTVVVSESDGRVLAVYVILPHVFQVNGADALCLQVAETAVHPAVRSGGHMIRAAFAAAVQVGRDRGCVLGYGGQTNDEAVKIGTRWFGYCVLFTLQPWERRLSLAPALRARAGSAGHALGRAADRLLRPLTSAWRLGFSGVIEPREGFGPEFDAAWERLRGRHAALLRRNSAYLTWRYARCPVGRHRALLARDPKGPAAFIVWRVWEHDGVRRATVLDILDGRDPAVAAALLRSAASEARSDGCEFLFFSVMPDGPQEQALRRLSGFKPSSREPRDRVMAAPPRQARLTAQVIEQMMTLRDPANWHYTQGDSDFRD